MPIIDKNAIEYILHELTIEGKAGFDRKTSCD